MMLKIPKSFRFMGKKWTVVYRDIPDPQRPTTWATTYFGPQVIYLKPGLHPDSLAQTFVHELLHILFWELSLNRSNNIDSEKEECLVDALANGLYALISEKVIDVR